MNLLYVKSLHQSMWYMPHDFMKSWLALAYVPFLKSGCNGRAGSRQLSTTRQAKFSYMVEGVLLSVPDESLIAHKANDDLGGNLAILESLHFCRAGASHQNTHTLLVTGERTPCYQSLWRHTIPQQMAMMAHGMASSSMLELLSSRLLGYSIGTAKSWYRIYSMLVMQTMRQAESGIRATTWLV